MQFRTLYLMLFFCLALASAAASDPSAKQARLQKRYEQTLESLKPDDQAGLLKLAKWCQANHLSKEAEHVWQLLFEKKHAQLLKKPTLAGYQSLATWCTKQGLKQTAENTRHEMLVFDYGQRKAKVDADDAKGFLALGQWCQKNSLTAEAKECWQAVLAIEPDNAWARNQLAALGRAAWAAAPVGLLKHQKVPGYTQETAWYHISVPQEHKDGAVRLSAVHFPARRPTQCGHCRQRGCPGPGSASL